MTSVLAALAALSLLVWLYLALFHGRFWRADRRLTAAGALPPGQSWPGVVALVPARNEADVIGRAVGSLLAQDYPGRLDVVLVDDHSDDGTARAAVQAGEGGPLHVVAARPLPAGWAGKVWALNEGLGHAGALAPDAEFVWLSDADIEHAPDTLRRLVVKAMTERRDLVSLMVLLSCRSFWERLLIPPFVYFFQMLYPFRWVGDPARRTAAAAGGCVLVRRAALLRAGGFAAIKGALIDDCALARRIKDLTLSKDPAAAGGGIWLGLTESSRSLRPYDGLADIWRMVARSAYTQLNHSPGLLAGTLAGMILVYIVPPLAALSAPLHGDGPAALIGVAAWVLMALTAWPTYRLYRQPVWAPALLPLAGAVYGAMTLDSARRHRRGRGGTWKGRVQAPADARARPQAHEVEQGPRGL